MSLSSILHFSQLKNSTNSVDFFPVLTSPNNPHQLSYKHHHQKPTVFKETEAQLYEADRWPWIFDYQVYNPN
jgi:hypothetical protein